MLYVDVWGRNANESCYWGTPTHSSNKPADFRPPCRRIFARSVGIADPERDYPDLGFCRARHTRLVAVACGEMEHFKTPVLDETGPVLHIGGADRTL